MKLPIHSPCRKGISNLELLCFVLIIICGCAGVSYGIDFAPTYGILGKWIGGIFGLIGGVVAAASYIFLAALINAPFERFWHWWRPYPPACENGTCIGWKSYESYTVPDEVIQKVKGLSCLGHRCKCGNIYVGGFGYSMRNRWVRLLPSGEIRPYLKHRAFGRWMPDDGAGMGVPGRIEKVEKALESLYRIHIPGWLIPCLMAVIGGAVALVVVWHRSGFKDPMAPWFVIAVASLNLILGCVACWLGPSRFDQGKL